MITLVLPVRDQRAQRRLVSVTEQAPQSGLGDDHGIRMAPRRPRPRPVAWCGGARAAQAGRKGSAAAAEQGRAESQDQAQRPNEQRRGAEVVEGDQPEHQDRRRQVRRRAPMAVSGLRGTPAAVG